MSGARILKALSFGCAMLMVVSGLAMFAGADKDDEKVRVIVLFKEKVDKNAIEDRGGEILMEYENIPAVVTELSSKDIKELKKSDKVKTVEEDGEAQVLGDVDAEGKPSGSPAQGETKPWGVVKIGAPSVWPSSTGSAVKVAILDTGMDKDHPDLPTAAGGINFVANRGKVDPTAWEDDNGHGSHCAGIIAAKINNGKGSQGVAPGAALYIAKVLNKSGSGTITDIVAGIDWAISKQVNVISMSLGAATGYSTLEAACKRAYDAKITIVAAAGNNGGAVIYPAAYDTVIAVSATDSSDVYASFTSHGTQIDVSAPGVSIYSTYKNGGYATMSGTSMACPHVVGEIALLLEDHANDLTTPALVKSILEDSRCVVDLGTTGWDEYYGAGRISASGAYSIL
jgi:subtilisin family serine protease